MIYIGIDTGVNTGLAVWDGARRRFLRLETMKIHEALSLVRDCARECGRSGGTALTVRVEDPRQRKWYGGIKDRRTERGRLQGVGAVKRDAKIWEDFLSDTPGLRFEMVAPRHNVTKLSAEAFRTLTGWTARTSEHARDAAMLVFGL